MAPINLGCCRGTDRCLLCNPPPPLPTPDVVEALVASYRGRPGQTGPVVPAFFGGDPPPAPLVEALGGLPYHARVRPDALSKGEARRLITTGCVRIELDVLTLHGGALRTVNRRYGPKLAMEMVDTLGEWGVAVSVVLAPGLPSMAYRDSVADAEAFAGRVPLARLHPVLVLDRAGLREFHAEGRYVPLTVGDAVTVCRTMMDRLEPAGTEVIRVGQQPAHDGLGRAIAGPRHTALRELVESRRALDAIQAQCRALPDRSEARIRCNPADVGRVRGPMNQHIRTLRAENRLASVDVKADPGIPRGQYLVESA